MLTEIPTTYYVVKVHGITVVPNIPSRTLAEAALYNLPPDQRVQAEIVAVTSEGKTILLG